MPDKAKKSKISRLFAKIFSKADSTEEVLKKILPGSDNIEKRLLVIDLLGIQKLRVNDIMTPSAELIAFELNTPLEKILKTISSKFQSRYLVYRKTLDYSLGYIDTVDLLNNVVSKDVKPELFSLRKYIKKCYQASSNMKILDLLMEMKDLNRTMAIIIDEFGGLDGVVVIEDIILELSSLTKNIDNSLSNGDLFDIDEFGNIVMSARARIKNIESSLDIKLKSSRFDDDPPDTMGGLISALTERVPQVGEVIFDEETGFEYKIIDADPRRIKTVKIIRNNNQKETILKQSV